MDIDLDHPRVRRHLDDVDARIARRGVTLEAKGQTELLGQNFHQGDQLEIVLGGLNRRHEHMQPPLARLEDHGGAHIARRGPPLLRRAGGGPGGVAKGLVGWQGIAGLERITGLDVRIVLRRQLRQAAQRQAETGCGRAGRQE